MVVLVYQIVRLRDMMSPSQVTCHSGQDLNPGVSGRQELSTEPGLVSLVGLETDFSLGSVSSQDGKLIAELKSFSFSVHSRPPPFIPSFLVPGHMSAPLFSSPTSRLPSTPPAAAPRTCPPNPQETPRFSGVSQPNAWGFPESSLVVSGFVAAVCSLCPVTSLVGSACLPCREMIRKRSHRGQRLCAKSALGTQEPGLEPLSS
jgi:hypothetical protein